VGSPRASAHGKRPVKGVLSFCSYLSCFSPTEGKGGLCHVYFWLAVDKHFDREVWVEVRGLLVLGSGDDRKARSSLSEGRLVGLRTI
jgi:hypothetical protein